MKYTHRIISFFIVICICIVGNSTLSKLSNYITLSIMRQKGKISPLCQKLEIKFETQYGYWKDIYKAYHLMAYLEYKKGNLKKAEIYIRKALYYHPYYPNGYKMLGVLLGRDTPQGNACYNIYKIILEGGYKPDFRLMNLCLSTN